MKQGMEVGSKVATVSMNRMGESDLSTMSRIHAMDFKPSFTQKNGIHPPRKSSTLKVKDGVMLKLIVKAIITGITKSIKDGVRIRVTTKTSIYISANPFYIYSHQPNQVGLTI